jgi:hypothetical protein
MVQSDWTILTSLILHDNIFAISGSIVNLGIGLWNNMMPTLQHSGAWSHEMLWLEPVTSCVNTNLMIDYVFPNNAKPTQIYNYNLTNQGNLVNFTTKYPTFSGDGQHINVYAHAYKAAVLSNFNLMLFFNMTHHNKSYIGKSFPLNWM